MIGQVLRDNNETQERSLIKWGAFWFSFMCIIFFVRHLTFTEHVHDTTPQWPSSFLRLVTSGVITRNKILNIFTHAKPNDSYEHSRFNKLSGFHRLRRPISSKEYWGMPLSQNSVIKIRL